MTKPKQDLSARIPVELYEADALLAAFGRWAMVRLVRRRCGSAEGKYRPKSELTNTDETDREPREQLMNTHDAMRVQRALALVQRKWRIVLEALYVPRRGGMGKIIPADLWLKVLRIPPKLSQARHLEGLAEFRLIHNRMLDKDAKMSLTMRPVGHRATVSDESEQPKAGSRVSEVEIVL